MIVIGHRGTGKGARENTKHAFDVAGRIGAEMDIRQTLYGHLVISHDPCVERLTNGTGYVRDMTISELKSLRLCGSGDEIPTSEEALDALTANGSRKPRFLQIDLKVPGVTQKLIAQLYERDLQNVTCISSFHKDLLKESKREDCSIKTGLIKILPFDPIGYIGHETKANKLMRKAKDILYRIYLYPMLIVNIATGSMFAGQIKDAKSLGSDYVLIYWKAATKRFVSRAHKNGLGVIVGMPIKKKSVDRMRRYGVDVVVADNPELITAD